MDPNTVRVSVIVGLAFDFRIRALMTSSPASQIVPQPHEVVAFWLVLWLVMPASLSGQLVAFALFRFFDAAKPGPVGWADNLWHGFGPKGGFGILFDDLVAAFCTLLVIALWRFFA